MDLPLQPERIFRARSIRTADGRPARAMAVRGERIVALSDAPDGLDELAGTATEIVDCGDLTFVAAFADAHEHLLEAARNESLIPMEGVTSIAQMIDAIRSRAARSAPGEWVMTSMAWH